MSTSANTATQLPTWKQEVNQLVAAHKRSKTAAENETAAPSQARHASSGRAAQAAARVAERFAHAPSYSKALADEARAAVRAAEAASRAAQEAQAAAQCLLDGLEAASFAEPVAEPVWELQDEPERTARPHRPAIFEARPGDWAQADSLSNESSNRDSFDRASDFSANSGSDDEYTVEPAQPIYANLIEFPREIVATRRVRPRLAEGPLSGMESSPQLSIFEVDPTAISTEPAAAVVDVPAAPDWMREDWGYRESARPEMPAFEPDAKILEETPSQAPAVRAVVLASVSRRLLSIVVDSSLITAAFLGVAMLVVAKATELPGPRAAELGAALALLAIGAAYLALFFTLARATPGMRYAGIGLSTLDGCSPTRAQRCARLMALPLSVLPLGLGLVWALFDDDCLTWHDRLSRTYLRRR